MFNYQQAVQDTYWIGANDRRLALFENLFPLPKGVSYNSYAVIDEKIVLFDTADASVGDQYLENLEAVLAGRTPDYLVILHMEPDHCAMLRSVISRYPDITLAGSAKAFALLGQFFPSLAEQKKLVLKEGDTLCSGAHTFRFITAPMVHWPEVLFAYDETTGALFSADAFGTFGTIEGDIFTDIEIFLDNYIDETRRYYANIVGKYGQQVQAVMKKAAGLDVKAILPLHGPLWHISEYSDMILKLYQKWSTYTPETDDVLVIYGSLYGHTASAAEAFAAFVEQRTNLNVRVFDVSKTDVSYLIAEVWRCARIVLFCPTYNNGIYPPMKNFLDDMEALGVQNRTFVLAENGSWAPVAGKLMREKLSGLKNCTIIEDTFSFKGALHASDLDRLSAFADVALEGADDTIDMF